MSAIPDLPHCARICFAAIGLSLFASGNALPQSRPASSASPAIKVLKGKATYYGGKGLDGKETANGDTFDRDDHTAAASKKIPLGSTAKVTNLENGKSVEVKVNDRGPALRGNHIDLSRGAARDVGLTRKEGKAPVKIEVMKPPASTP
jgi:peptidoglycan lytic transglycosylase